VNDKNVQRQLAAQTHLLNVLVHGFWTVDVFVPISNRDQRLEVDVLNSAGKVKRDLDSVYPRILPAHPS
jgi:hypothetical protein